jgi:hypothetical protein
MRDKILLLIGLTEAATSQFRSDDLASVEACFSSAFTRA